MRAVFAAVRPRLAHPKGRLLVREVVVPHVFARGRRPDVDGATVDLVVGAEAGCGDAAYYRQVDERPHERPHGGVAQQPPEPVARVVVMRRLISRRAARTTKRRFADLRLF